MTWTKDFEMLMREAGVEPYKCEASSCSHVSRNTFMMMVHHRFGYHEGRRF